MFDSNILLEAAGWTKDSNVYSGNSSALHIKFNSFDNCIPVNATVATINLKFRFINLNTSFFIVFWYTDGTSTKASKNTTAGVWTNISATSDSNKTLKGIAFSYGTSDRMDIKEITVNQGSTPQPYEPYSSEVWHDIPYYQHKTATDTLTLPAVIYPNDTSITVGLKGNEEHTGTPTPQNPVVPNGTGERTENLWDNRGFSAGAITSTHEHKDTNPYGTTLSMTIGKETIITQSEYPTGNVGYQNGFFFIDVDFSKYEIGDKVTISFDYICNEVHSIEGQVTTTLYAGKNNNSIPAVLSSGKWSVSGRLTTVITIIADMNPYVEVRLCGNSITVKNIMLNSGTTALPYEPHGYKIPISSAGQTNNIYLGEVETTRKVKKLVLDGTETGWRKGSTFFFNQELSPDYLRARGSITCMCSHYSAYQQVGSGADVPEGYCSLYYALEVQRFYIKDSNFATLEDFTTYLAAQYAAGTPVCVWYVLATPTTGIVNEPLMRIGDYADSLTTSVSCTAGENTLDVQTTVQPSEVTAGFSGWHPVQSVHERENGQWD